MNPRAQFAALIAVALSANPNDILLQALKTTPLALMDMVTFFTRPVIREMVIPNFDEAIRLLRNDHLFEPEKVAKYYANTWHKPATTAAEFDRYFWTEYVRDNIHKFIGQTWYNTTGNHKIPAYELSHMLSVINNRRHSNARYHSIKEWQAAIKKDSSAAYEGLYSGLFDVKGSLVNGKGVLYSYGQKAWANCMAFRLRMAWHAIVAQTI